MDGWSCGDCCIEAGSDDFLGHAALENLYKKCLQRFIHKRYQLSKTK